MNILEFVRVFPDDAAAEKFLVAARWPQGVECPRCNQNQVIDYQHKTMPYWCRKCRKAFSVRTNTTMQSSRIGYQKWLLAMFLASTRKKGISSKQLAADIGITQKSAWYLLHRIRESFIEPDLVMSGTVEMDETYIGGSDYARHFDKKGKPKKLVIGAKNRETNKVKTEALSKLHPTAKIANEWINKHTSQETTLFTDDGGHYRSVDRPHFSVNHSRRQYVNGDVTTNGIESHWALVKRGWHGTYHWYSEKHLQRYLDEFAGRFNLRDQDVLKRLAIMANRMVGRHLPYKRLVGD